MRVWVDLSNSPHPLLFAPIVRRLEELGHEVLVTARDNAQTVELARERWPDVEVIGGPSPQRPVSKAKVIAERVSALRRWARARRPDVALSHNSYAQIVAARASGIRVVTAMDFEHQPSNHIAFRLAHSILLPEPIGLGVVRRQGAHPRKVTLYPGLKEEIYLGDFEPNDTVLEDLGIRRDAGTTLVVLRTPPTRALYHRMENSLFLDVLEALDRQRHVRCIVLTRYPEQRSELAAFGNVIVPRRVVDARSLMYAADLVVGAGGTMTREAALLGTPTLTVYAGRRPGADRWLEDRGMLSRLTSVDQVRNVRPREADPHPPWALRERAEGGIAVFLGVITGSDPARKAPS